MTNAEYFLKNGNDDIDYFADKWIESDTNLIDFLEQEYKEGFSYDDYQADGERVGGFGSTGK